MKKEKEEPLLAEEQFICKRCGRIKGYYEHLVDPCLGKLPGAVSACCGHGEHEVHIIFENGTRIGFEGKMHVVKNYLTGKALAGAIHSARLDRETLEEVEKADREDVTKRSKEAGEALKEFSAEVNSKAQESHKTLCGMDKER